MAYLTPNNSENNSPFITLERLSLCYENAKVLKDISLTLNTGEIHALIGEHGAGKSSLCFILSGVVKPNSGKIFLNRTSYDTLTPKIARNHHIELVNQQIFLFDNLSVAENLFVSKESALSPLYNHKKLLLKAEQYLEQSGFPINPNLKAKVLDLSDRSLVDILKYLYLQPKLLILDETLDNLKTETLHKMVNILDQLKRQGTAILCVTHKIDELYQIADKVSVIKDGEIFISDAVKNIDKINLIKFAYTEITKKSQLEISKEEFYQLLKYNEAILQNLPVNLLVLDNDMRIKLINEHTRSFFQLEDTDYYNLPLEHLFLSQNKEVYHLIREAVKQERVETFYNVMIYTRENPKRNNITINPIYDGSFLIGTMLIIEDISEQEQLREQMMFSEKLASTGLLAAGVAHEINNPLEIIHNYLEFLKYEIQEQKLVDILAILQNQTETISQIVSNLIIFSDSSHVNVEVFDVNGLIESIIGLIQFNAKHKQIKIHFDKDSDVLTLEANKTEIQQVILNLFKNSFDAMPSGGDIFVTTALLQENGTHAVQMTFMDTGPGICDENPGNIFLPFYSTKQGSENNLGLGLSVSYGIIQKYNGTIAVKNIDNTGCQFVITLPQST